MKAGDMNAVCLQTITAKWREMLQYHAHCTHVALCWSFHLHYQFSLLLDMCSIGKINTFNCLRINLWEILILEWSHSWKYWQMLGKWNRWGQTKVFDGTYDILFAFDKVKHFHWLLSVKTQKTPPTCTCHCLIRSFN